MTDGILSCWNCGERLEQVLLPVSRHEYCPQCAEAVHCCRMCVNYSAHAPEQCVEDRAEPPTDKTTANFCDYFSPRTSPRTGAESDAPGPSREEEARAKLEALFGGGDEPEDRKGN